MPKWKKIRHWFSRKKRRNAVGDESKLSHDHKPKPMEKIFKELECPVCFNTCTPPIYTCQSGHIICSNCRQNIHICPTCREPLGGNRNLFAEHFIAQYSQPCKYAQEGCTFLRWKGEDMRGHEKTCFYRPLPCIVPSCTTTISYKFLLDHITDIHKVFGSDTLPATVTFHTDDPLIADRKWLPYYIKAFNVNFFLMMEVIRPHFWIWVWVQTPTKDLTNSIGYFAHLRLRNEQQNVALEWKGPVFPIRTPSTMITQDGLCFGGAESMLQHFEQNGLIRVNVNIEKRVMTPPNENEVLAAKVPSTGDLENANIDMSRSVQSVVSVRSQRSIHIRK